MMEHIDFDLDEKHLAVEGPKVLGVVFMVVIPVVMWVLDYIVRVC